MTYEILIAGFGGQGVMAMGKSIAEACVKQQLNVSWLPSYGPEMRGGTANCSVVVSDGRITTPIVLNGNALVVMNNPSLTKYEQTLQPGGLLMINSSVVTKEPTRTDIRVVKVSANDIAHELGNPKVMNMVMLGAFVKATGFLKPDTISEMIEEIYTGPKAKLVPLNRQALERGLACIED